MFKVNEGSKPGIFLAVLVRECTKYQTTVKTSNTSGYLLDTEVWASRRYKRGRECCSSKDHGVSQKCTVCDHARRNNGDNFTCGSNFEMAAELNTGTTTPLQLSPTTCVDCDFELREQP